MPIQRRIEYQFVCKTCKQRPYPPTTDREEAQLDMDEHVRDYGHAG